MRCKCRQCGNTIIIRTDERVNLKCHICGKSNISLSKNVFLTCDLCNPCISIKLRRKIIKADEIFNAENKCLNSRQLGQNVTYVIELIEVEKQPDIKCIEAETIKPKRKPGRPKQVAVV